MEIELKYIVKDCATAEKIWSDSFLREKEEPDSRESEEYIGRFYDTEDFVLLKNGIAFRMRQEGKKTVASLKWRGDTEGALHRREELNCNLGDCADIHEPQPMAFSESEEGQEMLALIGEKELHGIIEVNVMRKHFRVDTGESLIEVSLDTGQIITAKGTEPVCEVELELFSGSEDELMELGKRLEEEYALKPGTISKFARGLEMLNVI